MFSRKFLGYLVVVLISILAVQAFAVLDPEADMMGLYFDPEGTVVCTQASTFATVPLYVLYTHPSLATVQGFECGISVTGMNSSTMSIGAMPAAYTNAGSVTNLIVTYNSPVPTSVATMLVRLDISYLEWGTELFFYPGASDPSSNTDGYPMVMTDDLVLMPVGISSGLGEIGAVINGDCRTVPNEEISFGAVKSLFR